MKIETINIEQYMKIITINKSELSDIEKEKQIMRVFYPNLDITKSDMDAFLINLGNLISDGVDNNELIQRFKYKGVEYGLIPNFDKILTGEFIDLESYLIDGTELHRICSILYRPVIKSEGELYAIEKYEGTDKYAKIMKGVDFRVVLSAMVFFSRLGKTLLAHTDIYTQRLETQMNRKIKQETSVKNINSIKSLVGTLCFWRRQTVTS